MSDIWLSDSDSPVKAALRSPSLAPLQDSLKGSPNEFAVKRMWEGIEGRRGRTNNRALWGGSFAFAVIVLTALFVFVWQVPPPLELAEGGHLAPELTAGKATRVVPLNDGSRIELREQAELAMLNNEGGVFLTALRSGTAEFHVKPGGDRRWVVDAGALSVEVVGTVFTVKRSEERVSVSVARGLVRVRGDVPGGEVMLRAGDSVSTEVDVPPEATTAAREAQSEPSQERAFQLADLPLAEPEGAEDAPESTNSAESDAGLEAPTMQQPPQAGRSLDGLMAQADAARKSGDWQKASKLLGRVVRLAPSDDPRRGIAALSFARTSGDPVAIASALELGLPSMPGSLREPALTRLLTAYQATGQESQIRRVAHLYLIEYPQGPRSDLAKKLANRP